MVKSDPPPLHLFWFFPHSNIFHFLKIQEDAIIPFEFYPVEAFEQTFIGWGSRQKKSWNWELAQEGLACIPVFCADGHMAHLELNQKGKLFKEIGGQVEICPSCPQPLGKSPKVGHLF